MILFLFVQVLLIFFCLLSEIFSAAASKVEQLRDPSHDATEEIPHVSLLRCENSVNGVNEGHDPSVY